MEEEEDWLAAGADFDLSLGCAANACAANAAVGSPAAGLEMVAGRGVVGGRMAKLPNVPSPPPPRILWPLQKCLNPYPDGGGLFAALHSLGTLFEQLLHRLGVASLSSTGTSIMAKSPHPFPPAGNPVPLHWYPHPPMQGSHFLASQSIGKFLVQLLH